MNNQSPLVPQSSFLEQKNKGRTRVMIAVFVALSINGIGLMALLMQGCQKPPETTTATPPEPTNATPAFAGPTNTPPEPTNAVATTTSTAPVVATTTTPSPVEQVTSPAPATGGTEYTIAKGDTFRSLAKKFHVSAKAIADANPGVDPTKLKINQKIHIPPASAPTAASAGAMPTTELSATGGEQAYTVKSGDNLSTIAKEKGVTVKALRAANNLKTDRITVGQKLKIPTKAAAPSEPIGGTTTGTPPTTPMAR